ncbi:MAG: sulfatase-like hydrolase/transferase [Flavobacterium sp.]|nr:sulfatase-like hydrolase/transferase [Flavobacterium sp.]
MKKILFVFLIFSFVHAQNRNVVLIIADDLGKNYCDFYTDHLNTVNLTNVKRLLNRGVVFNNAWSNPLCSPTRAGILTGRYGFRTGVGDVVDGSNPKLNINEKIIPKILNLYAPNAISKACIGKWHVTDFSPAGYNYPNTMGFDHYEGSLLGAVGAPGQTVNNFYNWSKITNGVASTCTNYATSENVNNAISYLNNQPATKPFFLWLAFNAPHTPYHLPPVNLLTNNTLSGTQADITANPVSYFKAMNEAMDKEIGRFFDYLISSGKWDNTDIIFIGDNGDDSLVAQSTPAKGSIYQGGITVPMIISGPDIINPNRFSDALVNTNDLFATILELFGAVSWQSQIPTTIVDSKSLLPIILNQSTSVRPWAFTEIFKNPTVSGDGKTIRNADYKLLKFTNGTEKFFNLTINPSETTNLLSTTMSTTDSINYNYLCSEIATLVGSGISCSTLNIEPFATSNSEIIINKNPFTNFISLKNVTDIDFVELYTMDGKKIYAGKNIESTDFSYLQDGVYLLKVDNQNKIFKIVKQK